MPSCWGGGKYIEKVQLSVSNNLRKSNIPDEILTNNLQHKDNQQNISLNYQIADLHNNVI